jgi:MFS family permease
VIVDRFPKRKILLITQVSAMILAFILGILTVFKLIAVWEIGLLGFLLGVVTAVDAPARQAFVSEMVNKEQLPSAIALNSGVFNAARVIGPSIAGLLIALIGTGGAFIVNGLSYIAVIIALMSMKVEPYIGSKKSNPLTAIKDGLSYSFAHPIIATLIISAGVVSIFGWSYTTILPVIAKNEFHMGAAGLGYLYAASGLGSLLAAFLVAAFAKKASPVFFIIGGMMIFSISLTLFSFTNNLYLALPLLFFSGLGLLSMAAMVNTTIQNMVKSEFRGRVMSIYVLMFLGMTPVGNLQVGAISEKMGTDFAIRLGAIVVFIFGLIIYFRRNKVRSAYENYKKMNNI